MEQDENNSTLNRIGGEEWVGSSCEEFVVHKFGRIDQFSP